jgi:hypothetical protein
MEDAYLFDGHLAYLQPFVILYRHLVYFVAIWYILSPFGMLYRKNLATLILFSFETKKCVSFASDLTLFRGVRELW